MYTQSLPLAVNLTAVFVVVVGALLTTTVGTGQLGFGWLSRIGMAVALLGLAIVMMELGFLVNPLTKIRLFPDQWNAILKIGLIAVWVGMVLVFVGGLITDGTAPTEVPEAETEHG